MIAGKTREGLPVYIAVCRRQANSVALVVVIHMPLNLSCSGCLQARPRAAAWKGNLHSRQALLSILLLA